MDQQVYIKRPNLIDYNANSALMERMLREIKVCEVLRHHPQANIACHKGCQVSDGRIQGICFSKYPKSLMEKANPKHLSKNQFAQECPLPKEVIDGYISGLTLGVQHLHSLGFVHNDINPSNIMLTEDETPIIIDFESCAQIGEPLGGIKRTYEWHDEKVRIAAVSNDLEAVEEIRSWLADESANFKF